MAENDREFDDLELNRLLDGLAEQSAHPSDELLARVLADGLAEQPVAHAQVNSGSGIFGSFFSPIGGWAGAGGLLTAGLVGVWIGVSPPVALETGTTTILEALGSSDFTGGWTEIDGIL